VLWLGGASDAPLNKEGPEERPYVGGKHAFEVLEGGPSQTRVLTVQAPERNLEWLARENEG
jgi:hypothetical protein